jgi:succinate dehydrogenase / fumarate reductase, membrane anchor subunit
MSMRTPLSRVRGLGASRDGAHHFWLQRLTAIANVPLVIALVVIVINVTTVDYEGAREMVGSPLVAILLLLLILSVTNHMRIGMQVIIEDYVHAELPKLLALVANTLFSIAIAVACGFAILKISFGG